MAKRRSSSGDPNQPELPFGRAMVFRGFPWYPDVEKTKPTTCEHCGQPTNLYRRPISAVVARALIRLYHLEMQPDAKKWHHIREIFRDRGDWAKLKFWALIEEAANEDGRKKTSGLWRTTGEGRKFISCQDALPKYAMIRWNSTLVGFCGPAMTIKQCLEAKNQFSYAELMSQNIVTLDWAAK